MTLFAAAEPLTLPITDPVLIVAISALIFLVAPLLMQPLRLPGLVGLLLAGAVIGPNGLNLLDRSNTIVLLGTVGLLYLMFLAGIEIDLHDFKRYRNRSLGFGALTFLLPQGLGTGVMLSLGYDVGHVDPDRQHVRVAHAAGLPDRAALRHREEPGGHDGRGRHHHHRHRRAAGAGGDRRIHAGRAGRGVLDPPGGGALIYVAAVWLLLPRVARWFFRSERTGAVAEYVFVFAALFVGAYLAEVAGVEAIVGAFLVGLALNRLIPEQSLLANRIHFVGEAIFIPFFLLSVGMLVDVRVLLGGWRVGR
jgi:Kef-type K+ transport system membrane component KefB